eukprot:7675444-Pyramimonas_sp.AAC.1
MKILAPRRMSQSHIIIFSKISITRKFCMAYIKGYACYILIGKTATTEPKNVRCHNTSGVSCSIPVWRLLRSRLVPCWQLEAINPAAQLAPYLIAWVLGCPSDLGCINLPVCELSTLAIWLG